MILPCGVTGFCDRTTAPPPNTDVRAFRGHCYEAARCVRGTVVSFTNPYPGVTDNYAVAVLDTAAGAVAVLLNAHHPIVAFADPKGVTGSSFEFRDVPALADYFGGLGVYTVATAAGLNERPAAAHLRDLSPAELKRVKYFEPRRVGEIVFNFWD
ncbi:hypothetical protein J0H58_38605 [bacterium]|nr:hypothetical protein [bacterium]